MWVKLYGMSNMGVSGLRLSMYKVDTFEQKKKKTSKHICNNAKQYSSSMASLEKSKQTKWFLNFSLNFSLIFEVLWTYRLKP